VEHRIEAIRPRPVPDAIPALRRVDGSTEKRDREEQQGGKRKRKPTLPDLPPPPDDGMPHVDVRV
jgi:hypothetical protein